MLVAPAPSRTVLRGYRGQFDGPLFRPFGRNGNLGSERQHDSPILVTRDSKMTQAPPKGKGGGGYSHRRPWVCSES